MIRELRIEGLGVIDSAELELGPGLTVLTGETGAGKTMVLTALSLLRGEKADAGAVRHGVDKAVVEGRLDVSASPQVQERVIEAGGDLDDHEVVVGRVVSAEGRSRALAGGRSVPTSVLAEVADALVAVHGQGDQNRLSRASAQRAALDRFAGPAHLQLLGQHRSLYQRWRELERELAQLTAASRDRAQERDLLRFGLDEIEAVAPEAGEEAVLDVESARLGHAEMLRETVDAARQALSADDADAADVLALLAAATRSLQRAADVDTSLNDYAVRLHDIAALAADLSADLASYVEDVDADPARLATVEARRAELGKLTRKYGESTSVVLDWAKNAAARLAELEGDDERIPELVREIDRTRTDLAAAAATLHLQRVAAAAAFGDAVSAELTSLAMPNATLQAQVTATPVTASADTVDVDINGSTAAYALGPDGIDDVEFLLQPHSGAPFRPLAKAASGGERSRVMLAIEVVLAGADSVATYVFDEVDAGVGGRAATEVGRRLARLARTSQVIVVTHLPQVAAFADQHLVVEKFDDGAHTSTTVTLLDDSGRTTELARMLAGLSESDAAATHAAELLTLATPDRALTPKRRRA